MKFFQLAVASSGELPFVETLNAVENEMNRANEVNDRALFNLWVEVMNISDSSRRKMGGTSSGISLLANNRTLERALMINWPSNSALPQCIVESLELLHFNHFGQNLEISSSSMRNHVHKTKAIDVPLRTLFDPQVDSSLL